MSKSFELSSGWRRLTSITVASAADLALARVVADAVAVNISGSKGIGAGRALAEACGRGEGLVLADLELTGHELVQVTSDGASGEESEADGIHLDGDVR